MLEGNPMQTYESNMFVSDEELSDKELLHQDYIIKNLVICGMVTLIVSAAKSYTTTLLSMVANLIAAGYPDFVGLRIHHSRVLYLTNENPVFARKRFRASKRCIGISPQKQDVIFYGGPAFLITRTNIEALVQDLRAMGPKMPRTVIIDPIASMFSGDLSSSSDALEFKSCLQILQDMGIAIICGHHINKSRDIMDPNYIFGSQVLQSSFGLAVTLSREQMEDSTSGKKRLVKTGNVVLQGLFQKDARDIGTIRFKRAEIKMGFHDDDGEFPTSPFLLPIDIPLSAYTPDIQATGTRPCNRESPIE